APSTHTSSEFGQPPSRGSDLTSLPTVRGIPALVVTAEEEHPLLAVEMDEHAKQDPALGAGDIGMLAAEHVGDLIGVVPHAELVQAAPKRLEPLGAREVYAA